MKRMLLIALSAFLFGTVSAYLSILIFDSIDVNSEHPKNHWYDSFMLTVAPSGIFNRITLNLDLSNTYEERVDKENIGLIMLLNGFGWVSIVLPFSLLLFLAKLIYHRIKLRESRSLHAR